MTVSRETYRRRLRQRLWQKMHRASNIAAGRCIEHPASLHSEPHSPPRDGQLRCDPCARKHAKATSRAARS